MCRLTPFKENRTGAYKRINFKEEKDSGLNILKIKKGARHKQARYLLSNAVGMGFVPDKSASLQNGMPPYPVEKEPEPCGNEKKPCGNGEKVCGKGIRTLWKREKNVWKGVKTLWKRVNQLVFSVPTLDLSPSYLYNSLLIG